MKIKHLAALAAAAFSLSAALTGCTPDTPTPASTNSTEAEATTVTFRLWDDTWVDAYKASFAEFTKQNPNIKVEVEQIAWGDYWDKLPLDISSGAAPDIFWTNSSNFGIFADNGNLIDISKVIGDGDGDWVQSVVDLYTRNGSLWGVPQLWDSIALYYNADLVEKAGVDVGKLRWDTNTTNDTFLPAVKKLTTDTNGNNATAKDFDATKTEVYGFNASLDLQAIWLNFVAENGGHLQNGDEFDFATPEGVAAFQYLADLINVEHVAPPAADTLANGDLARDLFIQGKLALFQSGPYSLQHIADNAKFNWKIAPEIEGPTGRVSVVHGVVAVGNAKSPQLDATTAVLKWLGSKEGQLPLASTGASFPGVKSAQQAYIDYWTAKGVDVQPFIAATEGKTTEAPTGPRANAGFNAFGDNLNEVILGRTKPEDGLKAAQDAANEAIKE